MNYTLNIWPAKQFVAAYLCAALLATLSAIVLHGVSLPVAKSDNRYTGRPLSVLLRQPRLLLAMLYGVVTYALMNFLMTAAPLAMKHEHLLVESSNWALQWHAIAIYAPSFLTGSLISRFGADRVVLPGVVQPGVAALSGPLRLCWRRQMMVNRPTRDSWHRAPTAYIRL